jgi:hypothetical protein
VGAAAEQRERQHRLGDALLDRGEGDQQDAGAREQRDDQRAAPALVVAAHEPSTSRKRALEKVSRPAQSIRVALGSRDSASFKYVTAVAASPIGTLIDGESQSFAGFQLRDDGE